MPDDIATRPAAPATLRAAFAPNTWNADARTVEVVFTTGARVQRRDWMTGERFTEILEVSASAIDFTRLNAGAPVLDTRSSYTLGDVVGVVESAVVVGGEGRATLRFSERPEVAGIVADVANGILRNISVGYIVQEWATSKATAGQPEVRTATRWTPYELSLVPIPADPGAQVRAGHPETSTAAEVAPKETPMPNSVTPEASATAAAERAAELLAVRAEERQRTADMLVIQRQAGLDADWSERHIAAGTTLDAARAEALAAVAARAAPRVPAEAVGARQDAGEMQVRLLGNALEHRAGIRGVALEDGAREFRGFRLIDFARASIEMSGGRVRGMTPDETFREAFRLARVNQLQQRDLVTGDFSNLLANTASKSLRMAYGSAPRSFISWCTQHNLPDFKSFKAVALGGAPALVTKNESDEVSYGTLTDGAETWNLVRYGKALPISYEALINDDMSGFTRIPQMYGASAARLESETVYGVLTANAALADSVALFHATHANSSTGVLSVDATGVANIAAAVAKLRVQTAPNGDVLGLTARFLVVPSALELKAAQLFSPVIIPTSAGALNPMRTTMTVIGEPRLDAASAVAYYVMADPSEIDTIHYGYLDGTDGPQISSEIDFDTDGMAIKCMHNFGAKAIDYRGMVYSTGA